MSFGSRIKEARKARKLTQEELGKVIGVAKSTITGYEKGTSSPDEGKIIALMRALGVNANFLWQDSLPLDNDENVLELTPLSLEEQELVAHYRELNTEGKSMVKQVVFAAVNTYKKHVNFSRFEEEVGDIG
ncbi:hypothetical protein FACS1894208_01510 [Clostridia bacterium]|nr:hypothetical protein FACS1894208_01510 [Clostridia bacterium]